MHIITMFVVPFYLRGYHNKPIKYKPLTAEKMNLSKTRTQNIYKEYITPKKDEQNVQILGGEYWYN